MLVFGEGVEALGGAETAVGVAGVEECLRVRLVDGAALGLLVGTMRPSYFRTFIPL